MSPRARRVDDIAVAVTGAGAGIALLVSPYLAALTISAPDRGNAAWWRPRRCGGARCAVTAVVAFVLAALAGAASDWTKAWPAYLALALAGTVLTIVDIEHHRLPDRLIGPAAIAAALVFVGVAAVVPDWTALGRCVIAAVVVFALLTAVVLIAPGGLGFGDVKLAALLAGCLAWRNWRAVLDGLTLGVVVAGVAALVLMMMRRGGRGSHIPLGPFLVTAALVVAALPS
jgi:leader peptidase (prepilin peptidase) / N-methyltransferase